MTTRPEILLANLEAILARQNGHVPMTPRDRGNGLLACAELRAAVDEMRTMISGVKPRAQRVGPFTSGAVVVAFPGSAR